MTFKYAVCPREKLKSSENTEHGRVVQCLLNNDYLYKPLKTMHVTKFCPLPPRFHPGYATVIKVGLKVRSTHQLRIGSAHNKAGTPQI